MNIRSLTRGDGVVIGAAVLLFIASFLDLYSIDGAPDSYEIPGLWSSGPVVLGVVLAGIIGAALVVVARGLPQPPRRSRAWTSASSASPSRCSPRGARSATSSTRAVAPTTSTPRAPAPTPARV
ncbi:hypothetical protein GCM10020295_59290 [Streptomyces cinereospinus]